VEYLNKDKKVKGLYKEKIKLKKKK
jgi:hypothetical protein